MATKSASGSTVSQLLTTANEEGNLSPEALQAINVEDIGLKIQEAMGVPVDQVKSAEVVLLNLLIDDSGSIRFGSNADLVREGVNSILDALLESKQKNDILVHIRFLNGTVLCPWVFLAQAPKLTPQNYDPMGGTPLFDESAVSLATVVAKTQEFEDNGVHARSVTCIITDGNDEGSSSMTAAKVKSVTQSLLKNENHIVAAMGIDDKSTDYRQVFGDMGVDDRWILVPGNSKSEIRKAFRAVSQTMVKVSQSAKQFSQTANGGFTSP